MGSRGRTQRTGRPGRMARAGARTIAVGAAAALIAACGSSGSSAPTGPTIPPDPDAILAASATAMGDVTSVAFELEVALSEAGNARGYLALLRRFVAGLEAESYRRDTFRSLVAPELDPMSFGVIMDKAEAQERACLASL